MRRPDHRRIGAAVDDEIIGPASVNQDLHGQAGFDLARLHVFPADGEGGVEECRRERRHLRGRVRSRLRLADFRWLGRRLHVARRTREQQPGQQGESEATREQSVLP